MTTPNPQQPLTPQDYRNILKHLTKQVHEEQQPNTNNTNATLPPTNPQEPTP